MALQSSIKLSERENIFPGYARMTSNLGILHSSGHYPCYNLILLNENTGEALMAHINPFYNWHPYCILPETAECIHDFCSSPGNKAAIIIKGDKSADCKPVQKFLETLDIPVRDIIHVRSAEAAWDAIFNSKTQELIVRSEFRPYHADYPERAELDGRIFYAGRPFSPETRPLTPKRPLHFSEIFDAPDSPEPLTELGAAAEKERTWLSRIVNIPDKLRLFRR